MDLASLLRLNRTIRVIGFDDAPFKRHQQGNVPLAGVICGQTRFEGMVWGTLQQDGWDATEAICGLLTDSKFLPQLHLILLDGIGFGGFNLVDLPELATRLQRPCVAVMRRPPNLAKMHQAMTRLPHFQRRLQRLEKAGTIHAYPPFYFQVCGEEPAIIAQALATLTKIAGN